jgi:hypothetical protein
MIANCLLSSLPTLGWYMGVVVLDVVRGEHVLDYRMFNERHVQTLWSVNILKIPVELCRATRSAATTVVKNIIHMLILTL